MRKIYILTWLAAFIFMIPAASLKAHDNCVPTLSTSPLSLDFLTDANIPVQQQLTVGINDLPLLSVLLGFETKITGPDSTQFKVLKANASLGSILIDLLNGRLGLSVEYNPTGDANHSAILEVQAKILGLQLPLKIGVPLTGKTNTVLKVNDLTDAYIYGFPLVMMELTKKLMTNTATPNQVFAPVNQFGHATIAPGPEFSAVVGVNADTYSSSAWLDLSDEPIVIEMPDTHGRYYLLPMLDAFTNVFETPGSRTTGTGAQTMLVTGPSWQGTIPAGMTEYKSPTNMVWVIGRILAYNPQDGATVVKSIQDGMKMMPLSQYGNPSYTPPAGVVDPNTGTTPPRTLVSELSMEEYFNIVNQSLINNPPAAYDSAIIQKMRPLGVGPGLTFSLADYTPAAQLLIAGIPSIAKIRFLAASVQNSRMENGWSFTKDFIDTFLDNYDFRASVAYSGLGANRAVDTMYGTMLPIGTVVLNGSLNNYQLHFEANEIPPVHPEAFWSITPYDTNSRLVANDIQRYSIGSRDSLVYNEDGSLDIFLRKDDPGEWKTNNWQPIPDGIFGLIIRLYWPGQPVIEKEWVCPPVTLLPRILSRNVSGIENKVLDGNGQAGIYPNPASDVLYLNSPAQEVFISNITGQLVYRKSNVSSIPLDGWGTGLYVISVKTADGQKQYKFKKQ